MPALNNLQIQKMSEVLRTLKFKSSFYERPFISERMQAEEKLRMYFFSVGICHQTYALAHPSLNLYGWDYLEYGFLNMIRQSPELLVPDFIHVSDFEKLKGSLSGFFTPAEMECTLDRLDERVRLMKDMAAVLVDQYESSLGKLLSSTTHEQGVSVVELYSVLQKFEAYSDPLNKKSSFFIKLAVDAGLIRLQDPENLVPVMDYHMQRVLLRTGCVEIMDDTLAQSLRLRLPMTSDSIIREICVNASALIARKAGLNVLQMNDVLYLAGRSCCHEQTLCRSGSCEKTPCSLTRAVELDNHTACIFNDFCKAATDMEYHKFWQPVVETHYY
ncbi:MAG: queuosine salvage family protein [Bacteroidales bacterium]|jgi:hypothetical protein|nr:queuosine salvage family protein [Bacteroidales bacterium]